MLFGRAKRLWILTVIVHQANKGRERGKDKDIDVEGWRNTGRIVFRIIGGNGFRGRINRLCERSGCQSRCEE